MDQFEYKIIKEIVSFTNDDGLDHFNDLGAEGWELCGVAPNIGFVFKRKLI